jgi:hypothetical protein
MNDDRRATRWRSPDEPCLNCGDTTPGRFCPTCGQRKTEVLVSVRTLLADVLEDQLVLNRALPRTLGALLFRPGFLTEEYVRGRIVRYIAPFRLYLVSSIVFFLLLSFVGLQGLQVGLSVRPSAGLDRAAAQLDTAAAMARAEAARARADTTGAGDAAARTSERVAEGFEDAAALMRQRTAGGDRLAPGRLALESVPALPPGTLQPWARMLPLDRLPGPFERAFERKLAQVGHLPQGDAVREILRDMLEYAPHMVFLLLPLFALMLKLLYVRRSRYYAEHFVFALHVHAFVFTLFTAMFILPWDWLNGILFLWIVVYVWLALRRVYRQDWLRTTLKWWVLGSTYLILLLLGLTGLTVATLLLT